MTNETVFIKPAKGLTLMVDGKYYKGRPATMYEPREWPEFGIMSIDIVDGSMLDLLVWFEGKDLLDISNLCIDEIQNNQQ
jgi:hypothetical protein